MSQGKILIVDDEHLIRWSLSQPLLKEGYTIETAECAAQALEKIREFQPQLVLLDIRLPDGNGIELLKKLKADDPQLMVIMITAYADVGSTVEAFKFGAEDYIGKPFKLEAVKSVIAQTFAKKSSPDGNPAEARHSADRHLAEERLIGNSPKMIDIFKIIKRCAETNDKTVLVLGHSVTVNELLARAVHLYIRRKEKPYFEINCAAIPENLLENELFGHEKGAYTDAGKRHKGIFELADGGTVFLDEIGDMPLAMQGKILKAIENKRYRRLGGDRDIDVNVRIVAATNRDLKGMVESGKFRADLYYRLNVMTINLPALKERCEDIPHLARHFIDLFNKEYNREIQDISPEAMELMLAYSWPGNVRELKNTLERAIILEDGRLLSPENLNFPEADEAGCPDPVRGPGQDPGESEAEGETSGLLRSLPNRRGELQITLPAEGISFEDLEKNIIQVALARHAGNQTKAAQYLRMSRDTLRYRMKKFNLQ
ncbi:MAG: sigma-54-dependent Fis family transcriptional regulator [Deltaproteobacteria bacterium]|nr:sigma-54-dependent Fis family transcriptional regulator [Deltaproteobacteria bacterium]